MWLSIVLHVSMIAATIILFIRRNVLAFALAFYLTHLLLVSNFIVDIGATMGERLVYHSSFGFALAIALLFDWAMQNVESGKRKTQVALVVSLLLIIPLWCNRYSTERTMEKRRIPFSYRCKDGS